MKVLNITMLFLVFFVSCNNRKDIQKYTVLPADPVPSSDKAFSILDEIPFEGYTTQFIHDITQHFRAASLNNTVIQCKSGMKITVNPSLLEKEDGSGVNDVIEVAVIELLNSDDLFKAHATTVSDGKLLASGGTYFIGMNCNNQKLRIRNGCSLKVSFPRLSASDMQLFYGERNITGDINWRSSGKNLNTDNGIRFSDYQTPYQLPSRNKELKLYDSLNSEIYFYDQKMTITTFVNMLQKKGVDISIDTLFVGTRYSMLEHGQYQIDNKKFRIVTGAERKKEREQLAEETRREEELQKEAEKRSLPGQIKKLYAVTTIGSLGWLNCDRFNDQEKTEINIEPSWVSNSTISYFIIFRSINGLLDGRISMNASNKYAISDLPVGQPITIVAFTTSHGQLYQSRKDITVSKGSQVAMDFKPISKMEMQKMFGSNVKI